MSEETPQKVIWVPPSEQAINESNARVQAWRYQQRREKKDLYIQAAFTILVTIVLFTFARSTLEVVASITFAFGVLSLQVLTWLSKDGIGGPLLLVLFLFASIILVILSVMMYVMYTGPLWIGLVIIGTPVVIMTMVLLLLFLF